MTPAMHRKEEPMTHYSNGKKVRTNEPKSLGHYITVYVTADQLDFLNRECEKRNMKSSAYMRYLLQQVMEEAKDYLKK